MPQTGQARLVENTLTCADLARRRAGEHRAAQAVERRQQVHHALAEVERLARAASRSSAFVGGVDDEVADRQLERVLLEAVEARPRVDLA